MIYGGLTSSQAEAIVNRLGGMEGVKQFLSVDLNCRRTIEKGKCPKDAETMDRLFEAAGCLLGGWAKEMICHPKFTVTTRKTTARLVFLPTIDLTGNRYDNKVKDVFAGAKRLGLGKCAAEDGPLLRLQYLDQPIQERLHIGMKPIDGSVFKLCREIGVGGGIILNGANAHPDYPTNHWDIWVFRLRK